MRMGVTKAKMEARRHLIFEEVAKGKTYPEILAKYSEEWHLAPATLRTYISESLSYMSSGDYKEDMKNINIARLDQLYSEAIAEGDRKNALKAIDIQQKSIGAYEQKVNITSDEPIVFQFDF